MTIRFCLQYCSRTLLLLLLHRVEEPEKATRLCCSGADAASHTDSDRDSEFLHEIHIQYAAILDTQHTAAMHSRHDLCKQDAVCHAFCRSVREAQSTKQHDRMKARVPTEAVDVNFDTQIGQDEAEAPSIDHS